MKRGERLPPRGDFHTLGCSPPLRSVDYCRLAIFESPLLDTKGAITRWLLLFLLPLVVCPLLGEEEATHGGVLRLVAEGNGIVVHLRGIDSGAATRRDTAANFALCAAASWATAASLNFRDQSSRVTVNLVMDLLRIAKLTLSDFFSLPCTDSTGRM